MEISEKQNKAAGEIVDLIARLIGQKREVHSATAIAAASRLSGAFLFKSLALNIQDENPGTAVFSIEANKQGSELINLIGAVLANLGIAIDKNKMDTIEIEKSELDFLESLKATQDKANVIMQNNNLSYKEMSIACAISSAFIIEQCKNNLPPESGLNTAIYGLIEGSKTVPPAPPKKKKWYKF